MSSSVAAAAAVIIDIEQQQQQQLRRITEPRENSALLQEHARDSYIRSQTRALRLIFLVFCVFVIFAIIYGILLFRNDMAANKRNVRLIFE